MAEQPAKGVRRWVYAVVEGGRRGFPWGKVFDRVLAGVILCNVGAIILGTESGLPAWLYRTLDDFETGAVVLFSLEYAIRLWVCVEDPRRRFQHPLRGRLRYALTPFALIDLAAVLPFYFGRFADLDPAIGSVLRMVRVLKLFRWTPALDSIGSVLHSERRSLLASGAIIASAWVIVSTLAYMAERHAQPDRFGTIASALYWGIVTLSTTGYGDATPITPLGRVIAAATTVVGVLSFALPSAIIASGFVQELKRRDLVVTWNLVAKLPLFARFSAAQIASVASLLRLQRVQAGEIVLHKGDMADCMYFIAAGELEVDIPGQAVVMRAGEFFGEIALLEGGPRRATVRARTACDLMVLEVADFRLLVVETPELEAALREVMSQRLGPAVPASPPE